MDCFQSCFCCKKSENRLHKSRTVRNDLCKLGEEVKVEKIPLKRCDSRSGSSRLQGQAKKPLRSPVIVASRGKPKPQRTSFKSMIDLMPVIQEESEDEENQPAPQEAQDVKSGHAIPAGQVIDVDNNDVTGQGLYRTSATLEVGDGFGDEVILMNGVEGEGYSLQEGSQGRLVDGASGRRVAGKPGMIGVSVVQGDGKDDSSAGKTSSSKKNNKRKQAAQRNIAHSYYSEEMPGYRGDTDIDTVLSFIENDGKGLKKFPKQKVQEKKQKNLQKASSLEELSQRNIEDLTQSSETVRNEARRSWADQVYIRSESQNDISTRTNDHTQMEEDNNENENECEFQMVRKKQRRRRVADPAGKRVRRRTTGTTYRSPRRKSASSVPPSERSADSDLDSVHSLPAHGAHGNHGDQNDHASDSDCDNNGTNHSSDPGDASNLTTKDFPSLPAKPEVKPDPKVEVKPEAKPDVKQKTRSKSVGPNTRPPVILLDGRRSQVAAACDLTFGFEVNQQLLSLNAKPVAKTQEVPLRKPAWKTADTTKTTDPALKPNVVSAVQAENKPGVLGRTASMDQPPKVTVPPWKTVDPPPKPIPAMPVLKPTGFPRKMPDVAKPQNSWKTIEASSGPRPIAPSPAPVPAPMPLPQPQPPPAAPRMSVPVAAVAGASSVRNPAPSAWKSCELLNSKVTTPPLSELSVRNSASIIRTQLPQPKPLVDSFAKAACPAATVAQPHSPKDSAPGKDSVCPDASKLVLAAGLANHVEDKTQKRFNTYIVTNHANKSTPAALASRPTPPLPAKADERPIKSANEILSGKPAKLASPSVAEANGIASCPSDLEDDRERRVSDVMTSTDDLEAVSAADPLMQVLQTPKGCASVPEKAVVVDASQDASVEPDLSGDVEVAEDLESWDGKGEDPEEASGGEAEDSNPYFPFANAEHYNLAAFLKAKFDEAANDPETVFYTEE